MEQAYDAVGGAVYMVIAEAYVLGIINRVNKVVCIK